MIEEWLLAGAGNEAGRSRIRYLLDVPPPPSAGGRSVGSAPEVRPRTGISLERAQQMMRDAEDWDRSMGAG